MIYLDHAATTATDPRVVEAMLPYFTEVYGNASGLHQQARRSAQAIRAARQSIANLLNCKTKEIVFTASGSESDNLAIRGVAWAKKQAGQGNHLITSAIEHSAVRKTIDQLCDYFGFEQSIVPVNKFGQVQVADITAAIRPETILISVMYANNEVGSIQPIAKIGKLAREHNIPFHTDAVQVTGYAPLDVNALNVDLLTLSGHKFYAPKGIGMLYVRQGTPFLAPLTGGDHEHTYRPGTENVPYIVGLAKALEFVENEREQESERQRLLRNTLIDGILNTIPHSHLTGHPTERLPGSASFVFEGCEAETILLHLDAVNIQAASGSACNTGQPEPSAVLLAMGYPYDLSLSALRLTLGRKTTKTDIDTVLTVLPKIVETIRQADHQLYETEV